MIDIKNIKIDRNKSNLNKIIKKRLSQIPKVFQHKVESAIENTNMEGKTPIKKKNYGDPDIVAHKLFNAKEENKKKKLNENANAQTVLKY